MQKKRYFISFIGGIGAGKTTGAELISKSFGFTLVRERFPKNNFLPYFYKDMKTWAFHSQLFFLVEKLNQLIFIKNELKKNSVVQDVSVYQDVFMYMEVQRVLGNTTNKEYLINHSIYKKAAAFLPKPDLLIYLKWSPSTLISQIKNRGRAYEKNISLSYLNLLNGFLEKWVAKNSKKLRILTIDTQKLNFAKNHSHKKEFIKMVKSFLK